jgi:butyrate kinase
VTDELNDYARICGLSMFKRESIWHALNQRAIARRFAKENGKRYEDLNLIVAHLGGGISVAAHDHGRAVDVNNALDGEGPFSPERAGSLPAKELVNLCFSGEYTKDEILKMISGKGGVFSHLGTTDMIECEKMIQAGDKHAKLVIDAMIYHIAKAIAEKGAVLCGKIDAIIITGGIAYWQYMVDELKKRVDWMAPVHVYPGEDEMSALAANAAAVLNGEIEVKKY